MRYSTINETLSNNTKIINPDHILKLGTKHIFILLGEWGYMYVANRGISVCQTRLVLTTLSPKLELWKIKFQNSILSKHILLVHNSHRSKFNLHFNAVQSWVLYSEKKKIRTLSRRKSAKKKKWQPSWYTNFLTLVLLVFVMCIWILWMDMIEVFVCRWI